MDGSARLFLCAQCFVQVRLCSRCDRGQYYCTPACSSLARDAAQREAGRRYQRSRGGRMVHAARSRRWRIRHQRIEPVAAPPVVDTNIVTHQGSLEYPADAPLKSWTSDRTQASLTAHPDEPVAPPADHGAGPMCRRCGAPLTPWLRQGFLRRSAGARVRHDHSP